MLKLKTWN